MSIAVTANNPKMVKGVTAKFDDLLSLDGPCRSIPKNLPALMKTLWHQLLCQYSSAHGTQNCGFLDRFVGIPGYPKRFLVRAAIRRRNLYFVRFKSSCRNRYLVDAGNL